MSEQCQQCHKRTEDIHDWYYNDWERDRGITYRFCEPCIQKIEADLDAALDVPVYDEDGEPL